MLSILLILATQIPEVKSFKVDGVTREALVVKPKRAAGAPLVFVFHGHGGNMRQARRSIGIDRAWPEACVVYPQGLPTRGMTDPEGKRSGWQKNKGEYEDRDLAFFDAMYRAFPEIDRNRVYVTGHSNGGRMTHLLWAERGGQLAAVAPSGSPGMFEIRKLKPLPAFFIAGEKDPLISFSSQKRTIDAVMSLLQADQTKTSTEGYVKLTPAANGLEVATYIHPGGHEFPRQAIRPMVSFFKRHPK